MAKKATQKIQKKAQKKATTALRAGDTVMVIAGGNKKKRPNKGQTGKITGFAGKKKDRVLVEGLNKITKNLRQTTPDKPSGKILTEGSIHISNVMYYSDKAKKPVRIKHQLLEDGKKVRGYLDPKSKDFVQIES